MREKFRSESRLVESNHFVALYKSAAAPGDFSRRRAAARNRTRFPALREQRITMYASAADAREGIRTLTFTRLRRVRLPVAPPWHTIQISRGGQIRTDSLSVPNRACTRMHLTPEIAGAPGVSPGPRTLSVTIPRAWGGRGGLNSVIQFGRLACNR